jgi:ketosteroid isomerase-like protein
MPESIEAQNVATILDYSACLQRSGGDGIADCHAPQLGYRVHSTSPYAGRYGRSRFLAVLPAFFERQPARLRYEVQEITAPADRVCVFARGTMPLNSGVRYDNLYHSPLRLLDSKIVEIEDIYTPCSEDWQ